MSIIHDQREIRSGAIGASATRGVRCYVSLPAHGERGVEYRSPSCFDAVTSRKTGGRFGARPFSGNYIHVARASISVEPRQRVGAVLPPRTRLAATLSRRFISSRLQFRRIGYQPGSYVSDPCEHLERLSCGPVAYEQTKPRKVSHCAEQISQGHGNA